MYIKRLDESNYRDYQRCMRRIVYSMAKKGEDNTLSERIALENGNEGIMSKPEFLEQIANPKVEMYCLKDHEYNIGIAILFFTKQECKICDFAVFDQFKGLGTSFYKMLLDEVIRNRQPRVREIRMLCPFEGAQEFWKKQGFSLLHQKDKFKAKFRPEFWCRIK